MTHDVNHNDDEAELNAQAIAALVVLVVLAAFIAGLLFAAHLAGGAA